MPTLLVRVAGLNESERTLLYRIAELARDAYAGDAELHIDRGEDLPGMRLCFAPAPGARSGGS